MTVKERIALWFAKREIRKRAEAWLETMLRRPLTRKEKAMLGTFLVNWKTSVLGLLVAAVQLHQGGMSWQNAILAALMAALGFAAKDANVTGGTVKQ